MESMNWPPSGAIEASTRDGRVAINFGRPADEVRAAREAAVVVPLSWARLAHARGKDVREYLHRRVSNATKALAAGDGRRAFVLDAVGKVMADVELYARGDEDLAVIAPSYRGELLVTELGKYVFSENAMFTDAAPELVALAVIGPRAAEVLEAADLPVPAAQHGLVSVGPPDASRLAVVRSDLALGDFVVLAPIAWASATWQSLLADPARVGVLPAGWMAWETLRILRLVPVYGADFDETSTPLDAGLLHGLDRDKGCYPGQEAMARTLNLGHPARAVVQVRIDSGTPTAGTRCSLTTRNGTGAGALTSVIPAEAQGPPLALACVAWACRHLDTRLVVETDDGSCEVTVVAKAEEA